MRPSRRCTSRQRGRTDDEAAPSPPLRADGAPLASQLKLQLYRIYASVSRQREWFRLHESNVRGLTEEAEALRGRFFPHEPGLLTAVSENANVTAAAPSSSQGLPATEGKDVDELAPKPWGSVRPCPTESPPAVGRGFPSTLWRPRLLPSRQDHGACALPLPSGGGGTRDPFNAVLISSATDATSCRVAAEVRRVVPEYLLQLSPDWIHSRLGSVGGAGGGGVSAAEATSALAALLIPLLQALRGVVDVARWLLGSGDVAVGVSAPDGPVTFNPLRAVARHLFYLLHETLCCASSWMTEASRSGSTAAAHIMSAEERAEATEILFYLLDDRGGGPLVLQLLCTDHNTIRVPPRYTEHAAQTLATTGLLPRSIVSEAFDFLAVCFLGMCVEE
ncbi:uncharacterized protein Tco025E_09611 [Trypanosoma conorhini]|uniref:Uncharacterized protein n=1 Tax=Trypanosoma conorhini TaxID=83891 RepID=A0A422MUK1_9TRYP|nr:uncharacterized protein Tco025E_09611 [Trypanosoma conorhini]RNE96898.1 hypothetical protein Tco025E_09611 [Trypanosoma conorhini]